MQNNPYVGPTTSLRPYFPILVNIGKYGSTEARKSLSDFPKYAATSRKSEEIRGRSREELG